MTDKITLPAHGGPRPRMTGVNPHRQLEQQPYGYAPGHASPTPSVADREVATHG